MELELNIEDLKIEADGLGIKYSAQIGAKKLKEKIDEYYDNEAEDSKPVIEPDDVETEPELESDIVEDELDDPLALSQKTKRKNRIHSALNKKIALRERVANAKKLAFTKSKVVITNLDMRDKDLTDCYLGFENSYFGKSRLIPFGKPVWLENALIEVAESTPMTEHINEVGRDGKRTGNKIPIEKPKYGIQYIEKK